MERVGERVVVIGAGWAGIAATKRLLDAGVPAQQITVLERAPHAGGRAFSFTDKQTGLPLDNGQHVLLGCCDAFTQLLAAFDSADAVSFQSLLEVPVYHEGKLATLSSKRLAGPLHLVPGLATYRHLTRRERWQAFRAAPSFLRPNPEQLDALSFGEWLRQKGQSDTVIARLWDLVGTAFLNGHADEISAGLAAESFRMGVVAGWREARLGLFVKPLGELARVAMAFIEAQGVDVRYHAAVTSVETEDGQVRGVTLRSGHHLACRAVVSTVAHDALRPFLPPFALQNETLDRATQLMWNPILNVFLTYDQPIVQHDVFASTDMDGMFVFNRGRLLSSPNQDGRWLSVSISAATAYRHEEEREIVRRVHEAIVRALPRAKDAQLEHARVIWQPRATFLAAPNTWNARPHAQQDQLKGLFLAGDWTRTGWPACLEGAVRSGQTAANLAAASLST